MPVVGPGNAWWRDRNGVGNARERDGESLDRVGENPGQGADLVPPRVLQDLSWLVPKGVLGAVSLCISCQRIPGRGCDGIAMGAYRFSKEGAWEDLW